MNKIEDKDILISNTLPEINLIKLKNQYVSIIKNVLLHTVIVGIFTAIGVYFISRDYNRSIAFFFGNKVSLDFVENLGRNSEKHYSLKFLTPAGEEVIVSSSINILRKINAGNPVYGIEYKSKIYSDEFFFGFASLGVIIILFSFAWIFLQTRYLTINGKIVSKIINAPNSFDVISGDVLQIGFKYSQFLPVLNPQFIAKKYLSGKLKGKIDKKFNEFEKTSSIEWNEHYSMADDFYTCIAYKFSYRAKEYFNTSPFINYKFATQNMFENKIWIAVERADPSINYFLGYHNISS